MSSVYGWIGFILLLSFIVWKVSSWRMADKKVDELVKANKTRAKVKKAVAKKEKQHEKDMAGASILERARRMWNGNSS